MDQTINKLREIAGKSAKQVTNDDKDFIRDLAPRYGVELPKEKPNCKSCYVDAAVAIYKAIKDEKNTEQVNNTQETKQHAKSKENGLKLKAGVNVIWRGVRINEASATPENLHVWVNNGFPIRFCDGY
jgi:hypothetical protein